MATESIQFTGALGDALSARLELPEGRPASGFVLFAHCFTCSKSLKPVVTISRALADSGFGVMRFDFTGLGESDGDFEETNFTSNVADLVAAAEFLERHYAAPSVLVGHSLGGAAMIHAAHELPSVKAVATIGAPADPAHVLRLIGDQRPEIEARGAATVSLGDRSFEIRKQFLDDLEGHRMAERVPDLGAALLIFHSPTDQTVGIENAARLYEMAKHPKSFVSLDGADHLLLDDRDSTYVAAVLGAWAPRYASEDEPAEAPSDGPVDSSDSQPKGVLVETGADGYTTRIRARGHTWLADEPTSAGGNDRGPTPYELLLASVGACTGITLQMYAGRKGWDLEGVSMQLEYERLHARDIQDCEDCDRRLDRVHRRLRFHGTLDPEQVARLREIADRCPVHRTLDAGVAIDTLVEE